MDQFVNPKSMTTPGVAGALLMFVANSLCMMFPELPFRWVTIVGAFVLGTIVFSAANYTIWEKTAFWVVNSLIIFAVGIGTSNIGARVQTTQIAALFSTDTAYAKVKTLDDVLEELDAMEEQAKREAVERKSQLRLEVEENDVPMMTPQSSTSEQYEGLLNNTEEQQGYPQQNQFFKVW